jgi:hypothetical protein
MPQPESGKICRIWHLLDFAWPLVRGGVGRFRLDEKTLLRLVAPSLP